jgi:murein DD-endopeptidase MepM/ murein hydrolase activator NlpD
MNAGGWLVAFVATLLVTSFHLGNASGDPRAARGGPGSSRGRVTLGLLARLKGESPPTPVRPVADDGPYADIKAVLGASLRWWDETFTSFLPGDDRERHPTPRRAARVVSGRALRLARAPTLRRAPAMPEAMTFPVPLGPFTALRVHDGRMETTVPPAAAGLPDTVTEILLDAFRDPRILGEAIPAGAALRVVYENPPAFTPPSAPPMPRLAAVRIDAGGRIREAYCIRPTSDAPVICYSRDGIRLGGAIRHDPVARARITSGYSLSRYNPVLKRWTPHRGVDFAAPHGTPVRAVATGVVVRAGWAGSNGRLVRIRHDEVYQSSYAHLARIAADLEPGTVVADGQIIGYVGASGRATGPHLHFTLYRDGEPVDPLRERAAVPARLHGPSLASFQAFVATIDAALAAAATGTPRG